MITNQDAPAEGRKSSRAAVYSAQLMTAKCNVGVAQLNMVYGRDVVIGSRGQKKRAGGYHGPSSKVGTTTAKMASNSEVTRAEDKGDGANGNGTLGWPGDATFGGAFVAQLLPN